MVKTPRLNCKHCKHEIIKVKLFGKDSYLHITGPLSEKDFNHKPEPEENEK